MVLIFSVLELLLTFPRAFSSFVRKRNSISMQMLANFISHILTPNRKIPIFSHLQTVYVLKKGLIKE